MKVKCPVAGCDYIVKGADDGFKHWQGYDEFHKTLHLNFLKWYYPDLANSDLPDTVKWRKAYMQWHEDQKKLKMQKKGDKKEYTLEEFQQGGIMSSQVQVLHSQRLHHLQSD